MPLLQKLALVTFGGVAGVWIAQNYPASVPNLKDSTNQALDKLRGVANK
jgi:hypothetical protein